jgi:FeS assembly protein IscX
MNWEDYEEIAEKLDEHYPNSRVDSLSLSKDKLKEMIVSLPDFEGDKNDSNADFHSKFIRNAWIDIRIPKTHHENDSAYL